MLQRTFIGAAARGLDLERVKRRGVRPLLRSLLVLVEASVVRPRETQGIMCGAVGFELAVAAIFQSLYGAKQGVRMKMRSALVFM